MKTVVLITCTKNKHKGTHRAEYIYTKSGNFVKYLNCAKALAKDQDIYVISALHKLLPLDKEIEWYDYTLTGKSKQEHDAWGKEVAKQLEGLYDVRETSFIVLADDIYSSALLPYLPYMDMPLNGDCSPDGYDRLDAYVSEFMLKRNNKK